MRFWTAFQIPLRQAALIENGRVVRTIPDHPPKTRARMVDPIGPWDDKHFLVGRRNNIELWTLDGKTMVQSVYHPWLYGLHVVKRYGDFILAGCAGPDCVFLLDWDGNMKWSWFAHTQGLSAPLTRYPVPFGEGLEWQAFQTTTEFMLPGSTHLNSANIEPDGSVLVTLCHNKTIVRVSPLKDQPGEVLQVVGRHLPHDFQLDHRGKYFIPVYGCADGFVHEGTLLIEAEYVKRITQLEKDRFAFSHETGIIVCDRKGSVHDRITLPRPWHCVPF